MLVPTFAVSCLLLCAAPGSTKVALMPLPEGEGVAEKAALAITEAITSEVRRVPGVQLITQQEITSLMGLERQKSLLGCASEGCLAELGGALGVDKMVTGNINKLGETWLFNLKLSDVKRSKIVAQADRRLRKAAIDDLLEQIPAMVGELFGTAPTQGPLRLVEPPKPAPVKPEPVKNEPVKNEPGTEPGRPEGGGSAPAPAVPSDSVANGADEPLDAGARLDDLKVVTDGHGRYLVFPPRFEGPGARLYSGDGETFHAVRAVGGGADPRSGIFSHVLWDPRFRENSGLDATFDHPGPGKYSLTCGGEAEVELKELGKAEARKLVTKARFFKQRWRRQGYALARDDEGRYFYVDEAREPADGQRDFRFYMGTQGRMQRYAVTSTALDSAAEIFVTSAGRLKRALNSGDEKQAQWIAGSQKTPVRWLALGNEARLIYTALGVYAGERLGQPCDASMK